MENKVKLAIMGILLVVSPMPIALFFFSEPDAKVLLGDLLYGQSGINTNLQKGWLEIYSNVMRIMPIKISFFELFVMLASIVVFCISLAFVAKTLTK